MVLGVELRNHEEFEQAIEIFEQKTHQKKLDPEIARAILDGMRVRRQREREKELAKEAGQFGGDLWEDEDPYWDEYLDEWDDEDDDIDDF